MIPLFAMLTACEPINEIDGAIDGTEVTIASAWWTQYVSIDGTVHPQYRVVLADFEDGCQALLDYHADQDALEEAYAAEELTPEEFETEARQAFATHLPTESWQVVLEFLVQEGGFTELRVSGADWDRDARSGEIQGRFGHQTGMSYAGPEHLDRYASDQGDAELTHDLTEQTFSGDFTTTVADYVTGQTYGEVTILFEVDPCEGLGFEDAAIWW